MPGFVTRLEAGMERAREHLVLTAVPIVFALLNTNKILAVVGFDGGHIGFKFGFPLSVITVWQFVSVPNSGVTVNTGLPIEMLPVAVVTVPMLIGLQALLQAGYFGSLKNALLGEPYEFVQQCRQYFGPFLIVTAVPYLALLPLAFGIFGVGSLTGNVGGAALLFVLPAMVLYLGAAYLFYPTPYLIVLRGNGLIDAARQSYALAIQGGPYVTYTIGFALFVFGVSPFATGFVVNVPVLGLPVGILAGSVLGLGANFTTMRFVADLDPAASETVS